MKPIKFIVFLLCLVLPSQAHAQYQTAADAKAAVEALLITGKRTTPINSDQISNVEHQTVMDSLIDTIFENAANTIVLEASATPAENVTALQTAIDAADGRSEYTNIRLNGEWELNEQVNLDNKIHIIGGRFKRANESKCTTTAPIVATANSFTVAVDSVPSHWAVGTRVVVRDPTLTTTNGIGPNSHANVGLANSGSVTMRVSGVTSTSVTISNGIDKAFAVGAEIVQTINMFQVTNESRFSGCTFDGNKDNNPMETWLANQAIACDPNTDASDSCLIQWCRFINAPSETMFVTRNCTISDCYWYNNDGSGVHVTTQTTALGGTIDDGDGVNIIRPYMADCCLSSQSLVHAEAFITYSIRSKFVNVRDGIFINSTRATGNDVGACDVIGHVSTTDNDEFLNFENNVCQNFEHIITFETGYSALSEDENIYRYRFANNTFISCGDIHCLSPANIEGSGQGADLEIVGNRFWGSRIHLTSFQDVKIYDNNFYLQGYQTGYFAPTPTPQDDADNALVYVRGDWVDIRGNVFYPHVDTANYRPVECEDTDSEPIEYAIRLDSANITSPTQYRKAHYLRVKDNRILGFRFSIHIGGADTTTPASDYWKNAHVVENHIIYDRTNNSSTLGHGIVVKPGTNVERNTLVALTQISRGISINGGGSSNATFDNRWTFIRDNLIRAAVASSAGLIDTATGGNSEALCVINNISPEAPNLDGSATNRISTNNHTTTYEPEIATDFEFPVFASPF